MCIVTNELLSNELGKHHLIVGTLILWQITQYNLLDVFITCSEWSYNFNQNASGGREREGGKKSAKRYK